MGDAEKEAELARLRYELSRIVKGLAGRHVPIGPRRRARGCDHRPYEWVPFSDAENKAEEARLRARIAELDGSAEANERARREHPGIARAMDEWRSRR